MKNALLATTFLAAPAIVALGALAQGSAGGVPAYDHIVVVVEENHDFGQVIGSPDAPFINSLANGGALMTNYSGVSHPSEPNYLALYAGSTFGVADDNNHPQSGPTLASTLQAAGKTFTGFVDSGSPAKHNPWEMFPGGASVEKPMSSFPSGNFASLPNVSFVVPNLNNDMHDGTVGQADTWLQQNLGAYAQWAKANNSLLVVTTDENSGSAGNQVATIMSGANVKPGADPAPADHLNLLSTILASNGLAAPNDAASAAPISSAFTTAPASNNLFSAAAGLIAPAANAQSSNPSTGTSSTPSSGQNTTAPADTSATTPPTDTSSTTPPADTSSTATPTDTSSTTPTTSATTPPSTTAPGATGAPSSTTNASALPLASSNCPGMTFFDDFTQGLGNWSFGGSGALSDGNNAFASYQAPTQNATETSGPNGLTMSIMQASAPNGASWEAGLMQSQFSQTYGYFEATVTLPQSMMQSGATWAWWLIGDNWPPENDIAEFQGTQMDTAQHSATTSDSSAWYCYDFPNCPGVSMSGSNTHIFATDWEPDTTKWFLDGQQIQQAPTPSDFNVPMHMVIGSAALPDISQPASFNVQNVRVFKDMASAMACVQQVTPTNTQVANNNNPTNQPGQTPGSGGTPSSTSGNNPSPSDTTATTPPDTSQPSQGLFARLSSDLKSIQTAVANALQDLASLTGISSPTPTSTAGQSPTSTDPSAAPSQTAGSSSPTSTSTSPTETASTSPSSTGDSSSTNPTDSASSATPASSGSGSKASQPADPTTIPTMVSTLLPPASVQKVQSDLQNVGNEMNNVQQEIATLSKQMPGSNTGTPSTSTPTQSTSSKTGGKGGQSGSSTSPFASTTNVDTTQSGTGKGKKGAKMSSVQSGPGSTASSSLSDTTGTQTNTAPVTINVPGTTASFTPSAGTSLTTSSGGTTTTTDTGSTTTPATDTGSTTTPATDTGSTSTSPGTTTATNTSLTTSSNTSGGTGSGSSSAADGDADD